jgi:rhamnose transport system permease protein
MAQSDRVGVFREGRLVAVHDPLATDAETVATLALPVHRREDGKGLSPARRAQGVSGHATRSVVAGVPTLRVGTRVREMALLVLLLLLGGLLEGWSGSFLRPGNLRDLATDAALLGFCAMGATLVILAGGLDISLGPLMALSAGVAGRLWEQGHGWPVAAAVAAGVGGLGGLLNAGLALLGRVHPIVVTLGTMSVFRGLTLWWMQQDVQIPGSVRGWLTADAFGLPVLAWSGVAVVALAWAFLNGTVPGRELVALGGNPSAARRVGIRRGRVWLTAFTLQGVLVGLAGLLALARSGSMQPTSYEDVTLQAIAAAVVGGVAITGGRGSVWGVALGCLFLVTLAPACLFLQLSPHWQRTLVGLVLVAAVTIDTLWRGRGT